jgi:hypothetical protein
MVCFITCMPLPSARHFMPLATEDADQTFGFRVPPLRNSPPLPHPTHTTRTPPPPATSPRMQQPLAYDGRVHAQARDGDLGTLRLVWHRYSLASFELFLPLFLPLCFCSSPFSPLCFLHPPLPSSYPSSCEANYILLPQRTQTTSTSALGDPARLTRLRSVWLHIIMEAAPPCLMLTLALTTTTLCGSLNSSTVLLNQVSPKDPCKELEHG